MLQAGISALPGDASLQYALGLLLVREQRMDEALVALRNAWQLDAQNPLFGYVYGVALDTTGSSVRALEVWKQVLELHSDDLETLQALAAGLLRQGENRQARVFAERLAALMPGDRSVAQLLDAIEAASDKSR